MIKTILFDLGNVILPYDLMRLATRLTHYSPFSAEDIIQKIGYDKVAHDFETGRMSAQNYYDYVCSSCQFKNLSFENFLTIFNDIFVEDPHVVDLIRSLKGTYNLGLISNTNPIHVSHLRSAYPSLDHFDFLWFSNEAGVRKPDPSIYQMALTHFSSHPSETVFIDDLHENIQGAKALGIQGVLYQGIQKLKKDLSHLGVSH